MLTQEGLNDLASEIMALGYDEETAGTYAALIGDTPEFDADGLVIVQDGEKELARLKLRYFDR